MRRDVVGAGLAGLCAAIRVAQQGKPVFVLESHEIGGRAQSDARRDFTFNRGPHALFNGGDAATLLPELGIRVGGSTKSLRGARGLYEGRLHALPISPTSIMKTSLLSVRERTTFARIMTTLPKATPASLANQSARAWCQDVGSSERLTMLLEAFIRLNTYCDDLEQLSADAAVTQLRRSLQGVTYVDGGWQSIVNLLAMRARELGVIVEAHHPVSVIELSPSGVRVSNDDTSIEAGAVILACGSPDNVRKLVPDAVLPDVGTPVTATCLDLGLLASPSEHFILGIDESLYLSLHDPPAHLAPSGAAVLSVMAYGGEGRASVPRLDELARLAGVTDDLVKERRVLSSMTVAHSMPRPGNGLPGRPAATSGETSNCFIAGDWV